MDLLTVLVFSVALTVAASTTIKIDPRVLDDAREQGTTDIIVHMKESNLEKIRSHASSLRNADHHKRSEELYTDLKGYSDKVQRNVLQLLEKRKTPYMKVTQLWSVNRISVKNVTPETIKLLSEMSDVSAIREDRKFPIAKVFDLETVDNLEPTKNKNTGINENVWNVDRTGASSMWSYYGNTGQNITVANIDTGCRVSHICLKDKYEEGCWNDPSGQSEIPEDLQGHGTHTMGTIVGSCGIGLAPGATFSVCRGCGTQSCTESDLLACGDWIIYPTNTKGIYMPQCRPDIVSNSWGGDPNDPFYMDQVAAWDSAGIMHVFSCGNSGPECGSVGSPGDYPSVTCAAATDSLDKLADFSSRGPGSYPMRDGGKPDIAAPGVSILSAYNTSDTAGAYMSGTSMAAPHVVGMQVLMLRFIKGYIDSSKATPKCMGDLARAFIMKTAQPGNFNGTLDCDGVSDSDTPYNPFFGRGLGNVKDAYARNITDIYSINTMWGQLWAVLLFVILACVTIMPLAEGGYRRRNRGYGHGGGGGGGRGWGWGWGWRGGK
ncbi:unnamed protein product [Allacma fusca]|uniref:Peptidase S8/S53 domain-containing protein n=1 Tax=Allacma fusca TaxID=39272 RepID=A0A8J2PDX2_9HEXA|nr:unnamed protein product [Allacma fusca]